MTLKEVAAKLRTRSHALYSVHQGKAETLLDAVLAIEADPDFKLRERVEVMIRDLEAPYEPGFDHPTAAGIARRLRTLLDGEPRRKR